LPFRHLNRGCGRKRAMQLLLWQLHSRSTGSACSTPADRMRGAVSNGHFRNLKSFRISPAFDRQQTNLQTRALAVVLEVRFLRAGISDGRATASSGGSDTTILFRFSRPFRQGQATGKRSDADRRTERTDGQSGQTGQSRRKTGTRLTPTGPESPPSTWPDYTRHSAAQAAYRDADRPRRAPESAGTSGRSSRWT